ncbi:MAG: putative DNA-binding domain-containing protein [Pseudomonadota bacterium]
MDNSVDTLEEPDFQRAQREFSAYLRDPENNTPPPGLSEQRLAVYRHAVYANIEQFLNDNFPRVKSFYEDATWQELVRDYIVNHRSDTMCFVDLPLEFLAYLENSRECEIDPDFLYELAHFEWLETEVSADERVLPDREWPSGSLLENKPVLNPLTKILRYSYPVHAVTPTKYPESEPHEPTFIVACRQRNNKFKFITANVLTARLVELLSLHPDETGLNILTALAGEMGVADVNEIRAGGEDILEKLRADEIILGIDAV